MQQPTAVDQQDEPQQRPRGRQWKPGQSGNPLGARAATHAAALYAEVVAELGGEAALSAIERALLFQGCRLLVRSRRVKDPDAAIRMSGEARRLLESLRKRTPKEDTEPTLDPLAYAAGRDREATR